MTEKNDPEDDEVGYGKLPINTRFQKGKSGNPNGKAKRAKAPWEIAQKIAARTVLLDDGRSAKKTTVLQASITTLASRAAKGDTKAMDLFLRILQSAPRSVEVDNSINDAADLALIEDYLRGAHAACSRQRRQATP